MKCFVLLILTAWVSVVFAQVGVGPQPVPMPPSIEMPRDVAFRGTIRLSVDASDTEHKIFRVHETIPTQHSGPMVLLYPQWETSSHAATASAAALAGLTIRADRRRLEWRRDPVQAFAFHLDVPSGVTSLDVEFQFLAPTAARQGAVTMTRDIVVVPWQSVVVYPAGWFARDISVAPTLLLPAGFGHASALRITRTDGTSTTFTPTSLETLVDSPVYAGRHFKRLDLEDGGDVPIHLDLVADTPSSLEVSLDRLQLFRTLVTQTLQLFGASHYRQYDFLVALTDALAGPGGLEHLQSSENRLPPNFFSNWDRNLVNRDLLAHEFVHSWNGRFRQPADLWTPNFNVPMRGSLLWLYEGQSEFWGRVLAARAGLRTVQQTLDALAIDAATARARVGREWKSLQDSTNDPLFMTGRPVAWRDWQRREDYYVEGVLLWLDVETLIRERTGDAKGLDDFARAFFGGHPGSLATITYTFADVCDALKRIAPYDWEAFLRHRLDTHDAKGLLHGLERGGYRLIFTNEPTDYYRQNELADGVSDLSYSLGLSVGDNGIVRTVSWNGPAFRAGLSVGARIIAVNGQPYDAELLEAAVNAAAVTPLDLTFDLDGGVRRVRVDYDGALRYPRLQRVPGARDRLGALLAPRRQAQ